MTSSHSNDRWNIPRSVQDYAPWLSGVLGSMIMSFLLIIWPDMTLGSYPRMLWAIPALWAICGFIIQLSADRLLWYRGFQVFGNAIVVILLLVMAAQLATSTASTWGLGLILTVVALGMVFGFRRMKRVSDATLVLNVGLLDSSTGVLDPYGKATSAASHEQHLSAFERVGSILIPLIAGVSIFIVNLGSADITRILVWLAMIIGSWGFAAGVGGFIYFTHATGMWERENKKKVVLRPKPWWSRKA